MRRYWKLRHALGIIIATIILTGFLRRVVFRSRAPIAPQEYTKKYAAFYQYNYDGDTAVFYVEELGKQAVRFIGVDSPEKEEEGFDRAKEYTDASLSDAFKIVLELEPFSEDYDHYERLLAWVWVDDELFQAKLLETGNARIRYLEDNYLYADYLYTINVTKQEESGS